MIWKWCFFPLSSPLIQQVLYIKKKQLLKNSVLGLIKQYVGFRYVPWVSKIVTCPLSASWL